MESNDEFKEIHIKNCTCCYFDDIIKIKDFDFDNILLHQNHTKIFWFITLHTNFDWQKTNVYSVR